MTSSTSARTLKSENLMIMVGAKTFSKSLIKVIRISSTMLNEI